MLRRDVDGLVGQVRGAGEFLIALRWWLDGEREGRRGMEGEGGEGWNITYFEEVGVPGGVEVEVGVGGIFGLGCVVSGWMDG